MGKRSIIKCPECGVSVKTKNLPNHRARVHGIERREQLLGARPQHAKKGKRPLKVMLPSGKWIINIRACDEVVGSALRLLGRRPEKAIRMLESIPEEYPGIDTVYSQRGIAYALMGRNDHAIKCFEEAVDCNRKDYIHWFNLGCASLEACHLSQARRCFKEVLQLRPDARTGSLSKEYLKEIETHVESLVAGIEGMDVDGFLDMEDAYLRGVEYLENGEYDLAIENFSQLVELNHIPEKTHGNLGVAYFLKGDLERAEEHLRKALEANERYLPAIMNLATLKKVKVKAEKDSDCIKTPQKEVLLDVF